MSSRPAPFAIGLAAIVVFAALLRFWSIDFGLPLITHPDEPLIYNAADRMISNRTFNPGWFRYPALIIDIQAVVLAFTFALDRLIGLTNDQIHTIAYTSGRAIMAVFGVATVALTGLLGRRVTRSMFGPGNLADVAGLVAAGMLAVSFVHVKDSHFLKPDVPTAFFTALTLWFALDALERGRLDVRSWLLPGVMIGLAASAKYTGAVVAVVPVVAVLLVVRQGGRPGSQGEAAPRPYVSAMRPLIGMAAVSIVVFLLVNPGIVIAPGEFLSPVDGIRAEMAHYRSGHDGAEGSDTWRWYLAEIWRSGFGWLTPLLFLGIVGSGVALFKRRPLGALLLTLTFPLLYYLTIAPYPVRFDRQLMPLLPCLAILGGFGVGWMLSFVGARRRLARATGPVAPTPNHRFMLAVIAILLVALAVPQAARSVEWSIRAGRPDSRYAALHWVEENVPHDQRIVREWHTPPLEGTGYDDVFVRSIEEQSLDWYRAVHADYLILSSFMYQRYLDAPDTYPAQSAFYSSLLSQPRAATFRAENGPVIVVLRLDDVVPAFAGR